MNFLLILIRCELKAESYLNYCEPSGYINCYPMTSGGDKFDFESRINSPPKFEIYMTLYKIDHLKS